MGDRLNILFVSSEVAPFIKTGGLADVASSLPEALKELGHDVRVVLPEYGQISVRYREKLNHLLHFRTMVSWRNEYVGVNHLEHNGLPIYFIDNKDYFYRETLYENDDRHLQFAFFCRSILEMLPRIPFRPDIIHFNDWQTGPLAVMLNDNYRQLDFYREIKTVFTIHNLRFQGQFGPEIVDDVLGIDRQYWDEGIIRHNGLVNYIKMGIMGTDILTTVSKTYAEEIKDPYYGEGLDYAVRMRSDDLYGIVNGISYKEFDPAADQRIFLNYDLESIDKKSRNKILLQEELGLPSNKDLPVFGMVARLTEQKGFELVLEIIDELLYNELQFVLLGTGEGHFEKAFREVAARYPEKAAAEIRYDARLAQKIYAGSDLFLMPSRYEPCGLSQLISLRYGTIPVVRETGGLKDTITPYNEETGEGNGFTFFDYDAGELMMALERALKLYKRPEIWRGIIKQGMECDFSWERSARDYLSLYYKILENGEKAESPDDRGIMAEEPVKSGEKPESPENSGNHGKKSVERVNLNEASSAELRTLKGIGPFLAKQILLYRKETGGFNSPEELLKVKGINNRKLNLIRGDFSI